MSRFAAVPTAALDDPRIEAMHIRVLTSLCSFADKDGWCRVGQDKIALRARTNKARVSSSISDLAKWGWVNKKRIGKMKANVYQVIMDRKIDVAIPMPDEECFAETANHIDCQESKSQLPDEQITVAETANPIGTPFSNTVSNTVVGAQGALPIDTPEQPKRKAAPRGAARGQRISENWAPSPADYAFASGQGLDRQEINHEHGQFRDHWVSATGKNSAKRDWSAAWRTWIRNTVKWRAERAAKGNHRPHTAGQSRGGGLAAAGLRRVGESRGYGEPLSEERGMGAGYVIDREAS
ncbi:hypothetical protein [Hyphomonas sp.]|uniref:hypothetical protein n=1 Tax=Hyphomonas sp. TaxID=87 RepID=UPI0030039C0D